MAKNDVLKTCPESKLLGKKLWRNTLALKSKKIHGIFGETFIFIIVFSCPSSKKPCLRFLFVCSAREIKGFYQSSVGNEVDFRDIMNVSPNIFAKNQNFKKLRQFCRWKSTENHDINIFLSLENPCTFLQL